MRPINKNCKFNLRFIKTFWRCLPQIFRGNITKSRQIGEVDDPCLVALGENWNSALSYSWERGWSRVFSLFFFGKNLSIVLTWCSLISLYVLVRNYFLNNKVSIATISFRIVTKSISLFVQQKSIIHIQWNFRLFASRRIAPENLSFPVHGHVRVISARQQRIFRF